MHVFSLVVLTCALSLGCTSRFSETVALLHGSHTWVCNKVSQGMYTLYTSTIIPVLKPDTTSDGTKL